MNEIHERWLDAEYWAEIEKLAAQDEAMHLAKNERQRERRQAERASKGRAS